MVTAVGSGCCVCSNNNNSHAKYSRHNAQQWPPLTLSLLIWFWCVLSSVTSIPGAALYSNVGQRSTPTFEPICNLLEEHFVESEGKESSLILEFNSAQTAAHQQSCTRILSAPPDYGFIIRLILPKIRLSSRNNNHLVDGATKSNNDRSSIDSDSSAKSRTVTSELNTSTVLKASRRCPLNIFSSHDPHTPQWRVDPCQLEDTAPEMEDPVRLFRGRVRIVWAHANQTLNSKLMVTVLGKGDQCRSTKKHNCLRIGDEPILCISEDLVCDGIRHCPYSNEYDSDEDYAMCWKRSRLGQPMPPSMESDIFEHFALDVFRNLFAFDVPTVATKKPTMDDISDGQPLDNKTLLHNVSPSDVNVVEGDDTDSKDIVDIDITENATSFLGSHHHRRNGTRLGLNSDLSKYGPWGYLMLGMLLCGGALLICGLWASASQHAANNERESALQSSIASSSPGIGQNSQSAAASPPNYEELDPPPAYSVLFPNQKSSSNNTLTSLECQSSAQQLQLSPSAAPSWRSTSRALVDSASSSNSQAENN